MIVSFALAYLTGYHDVGEEVHLDGFVPVARAGLAAASTDVEREAPGLVAAHLGFGQPHKQAADVGEDAGIGGWVGAGVRPRGD